LTPSTIRKTEASLRPADTSTFHGFPQEAFQQIDDSTAVCIAHPPFGVLDHGPIDRDA
jgi:hypothetical protein